VRLFGTGDLRQQLLATANTTADVLATAYKVADTDFIIRMFADIAEYVRLDSRSAETFDFRSPVARMLDSLFATVYFHHIAGSSGGAPGQQRSSSSSSSSSAHHRAQHFEQQQSYIECVASARRQLDPSPLNDLEVRLSDDFKRSMNVTRLLLDAFDVTAETIRWTTGESNEQAAAATTSGEVGGSGWVAGLLRGHQCSRALTRMKHCAMCDGIADLTIVHPCRGFCLNVARGCLSPLVAGDGGGLGQAWDLFVHVVSQLASGIRASYDIDRLLTGIPSYLSTEISVLVQTAENINHRQVFNRCLCTVYRTCI